MTASYRFRSPRSPQSPSYSLSITFYLDLLGLTWTDPLFTWTVWTTWTANPLALREKKFFFSSKQHKNGNQAHRSRKRN